MTSESLFTKCNTCGKEISKSAKSCPQCGKKQKKLSLIHWIGIGFIGLIILAIVSAPDTPTQTVETESSRSIATKTTQPRDQEIFINSVSQHQELFRNAKNELQQSAIRDQRKLAISNALNNLFVSSWIGTINQLETNSEGKAILSVRLSPNIEVKTWNNALSDISSNTLIAKDDNLYNELFNLAAGQKVEFSGSFFPSDIDHVEETSLTIEGSMRNPEFLFKFQSVKPVN